MNVIIFDDAVKNLYFILLSKNRIVIINIIDEAHLALRDLSHIKYFAHRHRWFAVVDRDYLFVLSVTHYELIHVHEIKVESIVRQVVFVEHLSIHFLYFFKLATS